MHPARPMLIPRQPGTHPRLIGWHSGRWSRVWFRRSWETSISLTASNFVR
jgi:hypothetical protein